MKEHYKQRLNEGLAGEPDTRELDRQLRSVDDAFIAGYPRGQMHRAEVARNERVRGRINPINRKKLWISLTSTDDTPEKLARRALVLNKDEAAALEEPSRSKSKGDPRKDPELVQTGRMNADAFAQLSTFPTRSNPPGTIPAHLANNPALVAHHQQANAAWRYSPTGETEYYDPTRHPTNPRNLSQAARDIGRLRRGLLGNVSREDLATIFRLRQAHKEQRRSGGPRTGGKSLSEQIGYKGTIGMNLKEQYKERLLLEISPAYRMRTTLDPDKVAAYMASGRRRVMEPPSLKTPAGVKRASFWAATDTSNAAALIDKLNAAKARSEQERLASGGMSAADHAEQGVGGSLPSVGKSITTTDPHMMDLLPKAARRRAEMSMRRIPRLTGAEGSPGSGVSTLDDSDLAGMAAERAFHIASQVHVARMRRMIDEPQNESERLAGFRGLARHAAAIERGRRTGVWRSEWMRPGFNKRRRPGGGGFGGFGDDHGGPPAKPKGPNPRPTSPEDVNKYKPGSNEDIKAYQGKINDMIRRHLHGENDYGDY